MAMIKNHTLTGLAGGSLALVFTAALAGDAKQDIVCQATTTPGQYQVFMRASGAVLATTQVVPQQGATEPFGRVKIHPRLGVRGQEDIMVIVPARGECVILKREKQWQEPFATQTYTLLDGQKKPLGAPQYPFSQADAKPPALP